MLPSFYCRRVSDHALILLGEWWYEAKLSPFRFEHMRLSDEGFKDRVGECWRNYTFLGSPNFVLVKKLKCLKDDLRKRYKEVIWQLDLPKARALSDIQIQGYMFDLVNMRALVFIHSIWHDLIPFS